MRYSSAVRRALCAEDAALSGVRTTFPHTVITALSMTGCRAPLEQSREVWRHINMTGMLVGVPHLSILP